VVIEYDPPDVAAGEIATQALLLTGWLASALKWLPSGEFKREGNSARWMMEAGVGHKINIELRAAENRQGCDGLVASLSLKSGASNAEFYVGVNEEGTKLETWANIGDTRSVSRVVGYESKSEGQRLSRELSLLSRDAVYEGAVAAGGGLIEVLQKS
jgi:glucose-6-phosphate dehydrogenase assembly protein OpcA